MRTHARTHAYMHKYTHARRHSRTHKCAHTQTSTHTQRRARAHTHTHTCTHAHTHTHFAKDIRKQLNFQGADWYGKKLSKLWHFASLSWVFNRAVSVVSSHYGSLWAIALISVTQTRGWHSAVIN